MSPILRIVLIVRGSAAASLRSLPLPPWTPSSPRKRSASGGSLREPGGPQLPRFARCRYPPGPPQLLGSAPPAADRFASQGVRSCLASLVAATPLDPLISSEALQDRKIASRARGSAAASLRDR